MSDDTGTAAVRPKLVVRRADDAIAFYTAAFGAELHERHTVGDVVVYARLTVLGTDVLLKDEDEHDPSPATLGGAGVVLDVVTSAPDELAERAVAAGAEVVFPVEDLPYGARGGRVRDPFGHQWLLQTPITMTPEEVQAALSAYE